ncbi:glycosyltransferase [Tenacibaculum sp. M341]|uniref:glycosyltransferase n=1 Tax=Tenacibaculum sp. M341 TaxID=2530339 RepID=UPI00104FBFCF|nr:glycosyltransferase [Tenacibaculum sp. M341]TCI95031.1 glycosyltransferase [Tenacibaculum sp. M341]
MIKVTAIIPTLNEEKNIERAISSLDFVDELIVIDSFSTDNTLSIVKKHQNVKVLQRKFDDFSTQKNYAIEQATHDWIFLLDADEEVTPELKEELLEIISSGNINNAGYYIHRNFFINNKRLYFSGFQRSKVIRFFDRKLCKYEGKVHETIIAKGEVKKLQHSLNHYSYSDYTSYKSKLNHYAKLQAEELFAKKEKVTFYHFLVKPIIRFLLHFVLKLGFLDGLKGLKISYLHGYGVYKRYYELVRLKFSRSITTNKNSQLTFFNLPDNRKAIDVSIVIVNYKSWKYVDNCLRTIKNIKSDSFSLEVLVVDNFSNDDRLVDFSKEHSEVIFIQNTGNNGFANGCNVGAKNAVGNSLLFLNPDTLVNEDAIEKMLSKVKDEPDFGIVSCSQQNSKGKSEDSIRIFPKFSTLFGLTRAVYRLLNNDYKQISKSTSNIIFPDWVSGSTVFISKEWFQKINAWNEDFWMYFEDVDLCKKVTDKGGKVALLKDAFIVHDHGGASRINVKTAALTKSEVIFSRHVYVDTHFKGVKKHIAQLLLVLKNVFGKLLLGILGFVLFFIPKLNIQFYLLVAITKYYLDVLKYRTWLSKRSTKFLN